MMLSSPIKDFFVKAVSVAKEQQTQELNYLEAELIMAEEQLIKLGKQGNLLPKDMNLYQSQIDDLKKAIELKKKGLY